MYAVTSKNKDIINLLLEAGSNINSQDLTGETPLIKAVKILNLEVVQTLVKANADINIKSNNGKTALNYAQENNHVEMGCLDSLQTV